MPRPAAGQPREKSPPSPTPVKSPSARAAHLPPSFPLQFLGRAYDRALLAWRLGLLRE